MAALKINKEIFETEVLQSEKPVLLDFFATWCGPCKLLAPVLDQIAKEHPEIKVGKVNVDEENELATKFGVMSIPSIFVVKDGKITNSSVGASPKNKILELLK